MDMFSKEDFEQVEVSYEEAKEAVKEVLTEEEIERVIKSLETPLEEMKRTAAKLKLYLDRKMKDEYNEKGYIGKSTRLWHREYKDLLEKIQKAMYGEKSTNINYNISHKDIASQVRKSKKKFEDLVGDKKVEVTIEEKDEGEEKDVEEVKEVEEKS